MEKEMEDGEMATDAGPYKTCSRVVVVHLVIRRLDCITQSR